MKEYDVYLFDADGTLFDFDMAEVSAFRSVFQIFAFEYSDGILERYRDISEKLWASFEVGEISLEELQVQRFSRLLDDIGLQCDARDLNEKYLIELGKGTFLNEGAFEICKELASHGKEIYIVTNGNTEVQKSRISNSRINDYVSGYYVSESVGFQKPDVRFFDAVFADMSQTSKERIIIIGDSLSADIVGGINAGIDTCWYNGRKIENLTGIVPTYEIHELCKLLSVIK